MTCIYTKLVVEHIDNSTLVQLHKPFGFHSDVLERACLSMAPCWIEMFPMSGNHPTGTGDVWAPTGFVFDFESIPNWLRGPVGTNKRGGAAHDPVSRRGFIPGITKALGAAVYFEIMDYCDALDTERFRVSNSPYIPDAVVVPYVQAKDWSRRWVKYGVVRVWPGYWQKHELMATCQEIAGLEGDPYVQIDELIKQSDRLTEAIKESPMTETPELVVESEETTAALRDAKEEL